MSRQSKIGSHASDQKGKEKQKLFVVHCRYSLSTISLRPIYVFPIYVFPSDVFTINREETGSLAIGTESQIASRRNPVSMLMHYLLCLRSLRAFRYLSGRHNAPERARWILLGGGTTVVTETRGQIEIAIFPFAGAGEL